MLNLNSYDLPDDVFTEGEIKPVRPQKKKAANGTAKKRSAGDVCLLLTSAIQMPQVRAGHPGISLESYGSADFV